MKRFLFLFCIGLFLLFSQSVDSGVYYSSAGGVSCGFPDNFTSTYDACWTDRINTWSDSGGVLSNNGFTSDNAVCTSDTNAPSVDHYVIYKVISLNAGSGGTGVIILFRMESDGSGYQLQLENSGSNIDWYWKYTVSWGSGDDRDTGTITGENLANGDFVAVEVAGTGASTTIEMWHWSSDPGARGTWAAADDSTNIESNEDTGTLVGVRNHTYYGTASNQYDDFSCGTAQ